MLSAAPLPEGKPSLRGVLGGNSKPSATTSEALVRLCFVDTGVGVDVCGGRIGNDNVKFCSSQCALDSTSCGRYTSHVNKVELVAPGYYIQAAKSGVAYLQPVLRQPAHGFSETVLNVLDGSRTPAEWADVFSQLHNIEDLDNDTQQDLIARVERKVEFAPTPMRMRKRSASADLEEHMDEAAEQDVWSVSSEDVLISAIIPPNGESSEHVSAHWNSIVRATQRQRKCIKDMEITVKDNLEEIDDKVIKLSSIMGQRSDNAPALTVWASIGAHEEVLHRYSSNWSAVQAGLENKILDAERKTAVVQNLVNDRVLPVVREVYDKVGKLERQGPVSMDSSVLTTMQGTIQALLQRFQELTNRMNAMPLSGPTGTNSDEVQILREELGQTQDEVAELRLVIYELRAQLNTDGFSLGGHHFSTPDSIEQFVVKHVPSGYYGYCFDFVSLLECYSDRNRDTEIGISQRHAIGKAGYKDSASARVDVSFGCTIPRIFGLEEEVNNPSKKLAKLTSLLVWDHPTTRSGLKITIGNYVSNQRKAVDNQIIRRFGASQVATLFFQQLMQQTVVFWEAFSAWLTRFERELANQIGGDDPSAHKASVWNLVCWMIHSMFVEMSTRRSPGLGAEALDAVLEGAAKCAAILHGTLAAHKFMTELVEADFVRHPIFAATMDEFLLTSKASHTSVSSLVLRVKKVEDAVKGAQAAADKATKAAGGNKGPITKVT
jgi:hypothetical protein